MNTRPILSKSNRESPRKHYSKEGKIEAVEYFAHLLLSHSVETVRSKPFLEKLVIVSVSFVHPLFLFLIKHKNIFDIYPQKEEEDSTKLPKQYWNCPYKSIKNHFDAVVNAVNTSNGSFLRRMKVPPEMEQKIREYLLLEAEKLVQKQKLTNLEK